MKKSQDDVIAAIATPIGEGGISIIRVSGEGAAALVDACFRGAHPLASVATHTAHLGRILNRNGETVDQVIAIVYREPHSYTGEDTVEISCHGGMYVTKRVLEEVFSAGARPAEPGEFTKRAFLNGKMDLAQAEAVADLIHARTEVSQRAALRQLEGNLSMRVKELRSQLLDLCSLLELELDFAEEGIELAKRSELGASLERIGAEIRDMIDSYSYGKIAREGVHVAIVGRPNVGKSSIINNLLNENRAIVTDIPGTTRDTIEENLNIDGILFTVIDTAGVRESEDRVEREGISRTREAIEGADLVLLVTDASEGPKNEDEAVDRQISTRNPSAQIIHLQNKIDLVNGKSQDTLARPAGKRRLVRCSAKTGEGIDRLRKLMVEAVHGAELHIHEKSIAVTTLRQKQALERGLSRLEDARREITGGQSNEFVAVHLHAALDDLGEIVGEVTTEEVLNNIFSRFCLGK